MCLVLFAVSKKDVVATTDPRKIIKTSSQDKREKSARKAKGIHKIALKMAKTVENSVACSSTKTFFSRMVETEIISAEINGRMYQGIIS